MERVVEYIRTQLSALFVIGGYPKSFARDAIDYTTQTLLQHFHLVQVITLLYSGGQQQWKSSRKWASRNKIFHSSFYLIKEILHLVQWPAFIHFLEGTNLPSQLGWEREVCVLEKVSQRLCKTECSLLFISVCVNENLLPNYSSDLFAFIN